MNSQLRSSPTSSNFMNWYDSDECCYHRVSIVSNCGLMRYDAVYTVRQWWLVGLSYDMAWARITIWLMRIFKKGGRGNPENYRDINLLNIHLKLTTAIVAEKLTKIVNSEDEQQGFRRGRSCTDAIFVVRQLADWLIKP